MTRREAIAAVAVTAAAWLFLIGLMNPRGEFPMMDDWIYHRMVAAWIAEGRLVIPDVTQMVAVGHIALGVGVASLGGLTFETLRFAMLVIGWMGVVSVYAASRAFGATPFVAGLAAATILVNPIYLTMSATFMTDVPFFLLSTLALICLVRALHAPAWATVAAATLLSAAAGTIRQPALILPCAFLVALPWRHGLDRRILALAVVPFAIVAAELALLPVAFEAAGLLPRDYNLPMRELMRHVRAPSTEWAAFSAKRALNIGFHLGWFLLPYTLLAGGWACDRQGLKTLALQRSDGDRQGLKTLALQKPDEDRQGLKTLALQKSDEDRRGLKTLALQKSDEDRRGLKTLALQLQGSVWRRGLQTPAIPTAALATLIALAVLVTGKVAPWGSSLLYDFGLGGVSLYDVAVLGLPHLPRAPWMFWFVFTIASGISIAILIVQWSAAVGDAFARRDRAARAVCAFALVAVAGYAGPLVLSWFYDRYLLPIVPCLTVYAALRRGPTFTVRRAVAALAILVPLGVAAAAAGHDYFAWNRARWQGLTFLMARASPQEIDGGYEFAGLTRYADDRDWQKPSDAKFLVAFGPVPGYREVGRFDYATWLPPRRTAMLALERDDRVSSSTRTGARSTSADR